MDAETVAMLSGSAFLAGGVNSVAGGGTLLTFPALEMLIGPAAANATSTIALLPGSLAGSAGYRRELAASRRIAVVMLAPSLAGGLLGAWLVTESPRAFARLVPWLILTAAILFLVQPLVARYLRRRRSEHTPGTLGRGGLMLVQFVIALYGGYFGAGIGILMLATLGFLGLSNIHRMNAVKTLLAAVINAAAAVMFVTSDLVHWRYAGLMAVAAIAGGYLGARLARRTPAAVVRGLIVLIGFGLALYYFLKQPTGPSV